MVPVLNRVRNVQNLNESKAEDETKWTFFLPIRLINGYGVLGEDYPRPMVKHEVVSKENIARHKKAYDAGLSYIFRTVFQYLCFANIPFLDDKMGVGH